MGRYCPRTENTEKKKIGGSKLEIEVAYPSLTMFLSLMAAASLNIKTCVHQVTLHHNDIRCGCKMGMKHMQRDRTNF